LRRLAALMDLDAPIGRAVHPAVAGVNEGANDRPASPAPAPPPRSRSLPAASDVSVVVATRDRPEELAACLAALRALAPPPGEIVVVDSASRDAAAVTAVARGAGARLVRLDKPGLSRARNAGAAASTGAILAFLDDDCRVDPGYLDDLRAGFADEGVWAVTGLLLPLEIETDAQRLFLRYSHMDLRGFLPRRFDRAARPSRHWPIDAWRMGSGGNLAVRAERFARLGGFSAALGLGTPARGGEDLFLLWSIVQGGGAVVFRPGAMARHRHHRSIDALRQVLFGYGAGHAAYLRAARAAGAPRSAVRFYKMSFYADRAGRIVRSLAGRWPVPASLVLRELRGSMAGGPLARRAGREAAQEAAETARAAEVASAPKWTS
jgi:GT2 family glycosyltransferase